MNRIEKLYINNSELINELTAELVKIRDKYGVKGSWYVKKKEQLDHMIAFHDETIEFISTLEKAYSGAKFLNSVNNAVLHSKHSDIPLDECLEKLKLPTSKELLKL